MRPDKVLGGYCHHEPYQSIPLCGENYCGVGVRGIQSRQPYTIPILFSTLSGSFGREIINFISYNATSHHWEEVPSWHHHPAGPSLFPPILYMKGHYGGSSGSGGSALIRRVGSLIIG